MLSWEVVCCELCQSYRQNSGRNISKGVVELTFLGEKTSWRDNRRINKKGEGIFLIYARWIMTALSWHYKEQNAQFISLSRLQTSTTAVSQVYSSFKPR